MRGACAVISSRRLASKKCESLGEADVSFHCRGIAHRRDQVFMIGSHFLAKFLQLAVNLI